MKKNMKSSNSSDNIIPPERLAQKRLNKLMAGKLREKVDAKEEKKPKIDCMSALGKLTIGDEQAPKETIEKICNILPKELFIAGMLSYSSEENKDIKKVAQALMNGGAIPHEEEFASGLEISTRGSGTYCTFVSKEKKIIVSAFLSHTMFSKVSWNEFVKNMNESLKLRDELERNQESFNFVINGSKV